MSDSHLGIGDSVRARRALNGHRQLPEGFWEPDSRQSEDQLAKDESFGDETYPGFVSLNFIRAAVKRTVKIWCAIGLVGLLAGLGLYARPAGYEATTKLILTQPPDSTQAWITDDQAEVQSLTVAAIAAKKLGLHESASTFVGTYTALPTTDRILVLTVKAASADEALREANTVALTFLSFQKRLLTEQQKAYNKGLQKQVTEAEDHLAAINTAIDTVRRQASSPGQQRQLHGLQVQRAQASASLTQLKQSVNTAEANAGTATTAATSSSTVLDQATLVTKSKKRRLALYGGGGLIGGLVLGLGIVMVTAIASTRLRRRDDVARALGAPVRLSIRKGHLKPRRLRQLGLATAQDTNLSRMVAHLSTAVAPTTGGFASLAIVPSDRTEVAGVCLASLAVACAQQGLHVVMADLCVGTPAAKLVGVPEPGVGEVIVGDARLVVVVPDREDVLPTGPLSAANQEHSEGDPLVSACAEADLLLTLATLDPALGGDFLAEWTNSVIAVVTAGRSSAERIHSVGEMVRVAGIPQLSAVLLSADKSDESLGVVSPQAPVSSVIDESYVATAHD